MDALRRITTFFNIQSGEERVVGSLICLYFTLAIAFVLTQSMAFGVFIAEYGPQNLPYAYISIAIFASLAALLYIKLGEWVPFPTLLTINMIFMGAISFLVWLGLKTSFAHEAAFTLPLLFQIVVNMGNIAVWSLAGRLFDFRQGKRLFPLLGAGLWLANILGGLLVPLLVAWIGATNLLLLAAIAIGAAIPILRSITRTYIHQKPLPSRSQRGAQTSKPPAGLLQDRYILLIFAYIILWWVAFFFIDNIFYDRAAAQFPDADQLTAFMGQLLSAIGIVALFSSTFLASRVIGRFGLRTGLAAMPVLVTIASGVLAVSGSLGASMALVFGISTFTKLINVALGFSLSQSANAIAYQSMPDTLRVRVQAAAEGVVQPIAIGLAGVSLLALTAGLKFNYLGLTYVFLAIAVLWLIAINRLSGAYITTLTQAITRRRLGQSPTALAEPACVSLLQSHLHDPQPGAAIYALTQLEALDPRSAAAELPKLISHPAPEMRREALIRIENLALSSALGAVQSQLAIETEFQVREAGLQALGSIAGAAAIPQLTTLLSENEPHALRGGLTGLLKYGGSEGRSAAGQKLNQLLASPQSADRILAAQVLGQAYYPSFEPALQTLLHDPNPKVRCEALEAAGKISRPEWIAPIIAACDHPETSRAAANALTTTGALAFSEIESAFSQPGAPRRRLVTLAKVLGRSGDPRAQILLQPYLDTPDSQLRSQVLSALSQCGFRTRDLARIKTAIQREAAWAAWLSSAQVEFSSGEETMLLSAALEQAIAQLRERMLLLLSFVFDTNALLRVREAFIAGLATQLDFSLEIVDTQLPADWKRMVMPVLEDLSPQDRLQRLTTLFPQPQQDPHERLRLLIDGFEGDQITDWMRVCAIYTTGRLSVQSYREAIKAASDSSDPLVSETARWALAQTAPDSKQKGNQAMYSTVEKVLILKSVQMFSQTPDEVLADVAGLLEEMEISAGETIFNKGDLGDSMYVIVDGKVRVHDGERLLNELGERDVFGEMALLDPEPRLASVTAVDPSRLFRLDQAPFYQLIAERPEVATGIIRVLTRHLRNRVRDIAQLNARNTELESLVQAA